MSLKDTDVRTPGDASIAKKFKLSLARVRQLVADGAKHEKEHNTNQKKAEEVARDHIAERPDYYKMLKKANKTKVSMKEEMSISGVRGLGYISGDPAADPVNKYINSNAMSYVDENGNKLEWIKKQHAHLHNKGLGYNFFDPTDVKGSKNFMSEGISAGPERTQDYSIGDAGGGRTLYRKSGMEEGAKLDKAKKAVMAGVTAANMYTLADVAGRATEGGHGSPKGDIVRAATALPGAAGWGATAVHYGKKGYDAAKEALKKKKAQMEEEKKMSNPCWKGYKAYGMKKKNGKEVPNCVPVEETAAWQRKAGKNPEGGLNRKGIASYRRENPGSKLSMAVTTPPSKLKPGSKAAKRRKSFCARMGGMPGPMKDEKGRPTRKALSLRKWNCEEENKYPNTAERGIYEGDDREVVYTHKKGPLYGTVTQHSDGTISSRRKVGMYWRGRTHSSKESAIAHLENDGKKKKLREQHIVEKAPPGDKYERMVKHIKSGYAKDGLTKKEKGIAFATAWKAKNKEKLNELKAETLGSYIKKASTSRKKSLEGPKADIKTWGKRQKGITTAVKQLTKENSKDKDWDEATGPMGKSDVAENMNKPDTRYAPGATGITRTIHEDTKMDNTNLINEAIENILENNLIDMKENFKAVLEEKAIEKLEERKKEIAAEYFAQ